MSADDSSPESVDGRSPAGREPGLDGVVPFRFECQRSGRCCTGGAGFIWVEEREVAALAAAVEMSEEAFAQHYLRTAVDPRSGVQRLSLRERGTPGDTGAACALLEGGRQCTVYAARPEHCRSYPHWKSILEDREAFESARETCPGITPLATAEQREVAFEALRVLYDELDSAIAELQPLCVRSGLCCRFEEVGHELYATNLEADYAAERRPQAPAPEAPGRCPYHVKGVCQAREGRPIGCRTYFCDPRTEQRLAEVHEQFLARARRIERENDYPAGYARFPAMLAIRGVGRVADIEAMKDEGTHQDDER
jgi:Fe-S-cluster containining protein